MISGIVELLTPRRAAGWAYDSDDLKAPLAFRVRQGENVLAHLQFAQQSTRGSEVPPAEEFHAQVFDLEFPNPIDRALLRELTVEASVFASDNWRPLPRHLKVGPPLPEGQVPASNDMAFRSEHLEKANRTTSYWSHDGTGEAHAALQSFPVFVLGAARSGTSALGLALEKGTRYRGFSEGHIFDLSIRLAHAVNAHFDKKDQWIPAKDCASYHLGQIGHAWVKAETLELIRRMAAGFTTPFWFDKTPTYEMVASVPVLAEAWPNARFIFMKRRGLENLRSRIRKFTVGNFAGKCRDWNIIMSSWRAVREMVQGKFVELDQRTLAESPDAAAASVGQLLNLDNSEIESFASVLRNERPEATGPLWNYVADVSELDWSAEQLETFRQTCGAEMDAYGYTYDGTYCK